MDEIRRTLNEITRAWREQRFDDLSGFFDENVVMKGPGLKDLVRGRAALVASFADFMGKSKILRYEELNHSVERWGETAAASYDWTMTYEQAGTTSSEIGQDMFVFNRQDGQWKAVLRVMLF